MSIEVHLDWEGVTHPVGVLHSAARGSTVTFEYSTEWLVRPGAFAIDPTSLPLRPGPHHGTSLFGAFQDCGPDRWGRVLIERAVRRHVLESKPYRDLDYVLALEDSSRIGALRFGTDPTGPFLAASDGRIPPVVQLAGLADFSTKLCHSSELLLHPSSVSVLVSAISGRIMCHVNAPNPDPRRTRARPAAMPGLNPAPLRSIQGSLTWSSPTVSRPGCARVRRASTSRSACIRADA